MEILFFFKYIRKNILLLYQISRNLLNLYLLDPNFILMARNEIRNICY